MRTATVAPPSAWRREEVEKDSSWIQRLSSDEVAGVDAALEFAKKQGKPLLAMSPDDFPLTAAASAALERAVQSTQTKWGFCLVKGFPVDRWSEDDARLAYWGMGLHMGVARPQNKNSDILNDVRDAGGQYYGTGGRGYNTNAELDFHIDFGDVVGLLCRRTAKTGGRSLITSSRAAYDEIVRTRPDLVETLRQPFHFSWQGAGGKTSAPHYKCPVAGFKDEHFAFRSNRKNIIAAQRDFADVPRLTEKQNELMDLLETLYPDPRFCFSMQLEAGDMQLLNNYHIIHSRTQFTDYEEADKKRHLIRLWLAIPGCQPLPDAWNEPYKSTLANSVRGGLRGLGMTQEFLNFEAEMAAHHDMNNHYYQGHPL